MSAEVGSFSHKLTYSLTSFWNHWSRPLLVIRQNAAWRRFHIGFRPWQSSIFYTVSDTNWLLDVTCISKTFLFSNRHLNFGLLWWLSRNVCVCVIWKQCEWDDDTEQGVCVCVCVFLYCKCTFSTSQLVVSHSPLRWEGKTYHTHTHKHKHTHRWFRMACLCVCECNLSACV